MLQSAHVLCDVTHFRCDVVGCPAERHGAPVADDVLLAHAEVGDLDVSVLVEKDVVKLQVSANGQETGLQTND